MFFAQPFLGVLRFSLISCTWMGRQMAAARLVNRRDGFSAVVALAYGPAAPTLRSEL